MFAGFGAPLDNEEPTTPKRRPAGNREATPKLFTSLNPPSASEGATLAAGLFVAGQPLEAPLFHAVTWRVGQTFHPSEDPDRTAQPWTPPDFVRRDPRGQHAGLQVEEIELPKKPTQQSFARVVRNVLSEQDCAALISYVNAKGYTPALLNVGGGMQQLQPTCRDGFRVIVNSEPLTSWLLEVLRPVLPGSCPAGRVPKQLRSLNERCRFLCYTPGQQFGEHYDGKFIHPRTGHSSFVTVQLYLHDVPAGSGGATTFLFGKHGSIACQPGAGSVLIFTQDLLHEGSRLDAGLKYTFRTEAMYG